MKQLSVIDPTQKRIRPPFESILPKEPCVMMCPIGCGSINTIDETFKHWEAGHFDGMVCECGFTYGVGSSHGHVVPPSLEKMPLGDHSEDNHVRADKMTELELLEDQRRKMEWFTKEVFSLVGMEYRKPCACHSFVLGFLALDTLKKRLGSETK